MKQLTLALILLLYFISPLIAQNDGEISKLRDQIKNEQVNSKRAVLLSQLAWILRREAPVEEVDSLANLALSISFIDKDSFDLGTGLAKKVLGFLSIKKDKERAIQLYREAIEALTPGNYFEEIASVYLLLGNLLSDQGELDKAMEEYYTGIRFADSCKDDAVRASLYSMIARVKLRQKDYITAEKYFKDAIAIQQGIDAPKRLATVYYNIGDLYVKMDSLDLAGDYYDKAEIIFKEEKADWQLSLVIGAKGNIHFKKADLGKALDFYNESLRLKRTTNDTTGIAYAYYQIGNLLLKKEYYKEARPYMESCIEIAEEKDIMQLINLGHKKISEIDEEMGAHKNALINYKKHKAAEKEIINEKTQQSIKETEAKYENEKLQRKNEQQAASAKKGEIVRNSIIGVLGLISIIAFLLVRHYQQKRKIAIQMATQQEKIYQQDILQMQQTGELRALNASQDGQEKERKRIAEALHNSMGSLLSAIQMHFQTISEMVTFQQNDTEVLFNKSLELIKEAAVTNREIAHEMMPPILMKFGLGSSLDSLADKMNGPDINVSTAVYGLEQRLPEQLELSLYRIIDELINNIIKHAKATEVNIQLVEHEDALNVIVEDNGIGFNYDPNDTKYGMGLSNIITRVNHFKGKLEIDSSLGNGTTIIIDIPQQTYK